MGPGNIDFSQFKNKMQAMGVIMKDFGKTADGKLVNDILKNSADAVMAPCRVRSMAAYRPALKTISRALALLALLLWVIGSAAPMAGHAQALPGSSKTSLWEIPAEGGGVFLRIDPFHARG